MQDISKSYLERVVGILPRRYGLKKDRIFLYGAPAVGKSALAFFHSVWHKKTLYINCADCRTDIESANAFILKSYLERNLELLIVDNYTPAISLPNLSHIILIAPSIAHCPKDFTPKHIRALSFEEYVSFDNKNISISNLFNLFLKEGNLPEIQRLQPSYKITRKQEILKLALKNNFALFCSLLSMQGQKLTINHIYTLLKKSHKISKDKIYPWLSSLEKCGIISLVPHRKNANKKLYFYDFTLPLCVRNEKNLIAILENMLLLELYAKLERTGKSDIIEYGDVGEFVCALGIFLFLPFATQEHIESKLATYTQKTHMYIITLNFEGKGKIKNITYQAMSFINFALEWEAENLPL
ncbi:ATP-binding protein [Helicobacter sp. MIT 21-1697]|uniref:ATP-binding protein n=1 Tax=Helicobacter sp. MIT 21-1697 TaxID=2993733 RepID=UPI00224AEB11|nr:ATP-binding protein [Helicobacter sp. MIT 21-1697]MCX2716375.1 ATP-binding protein [Helicobacter sp. MIT 21-1697]